MVLGTFKMVFTYLLNFDCRRKFCLFDIFFLSVSEDEGWRFKYFYLLILQWVPNFLYLFVGRWACGYFLLQWDFPLKNQANSSNIKSI